MAPRRRNRRLVGDTIIWVVATVAGFDMLVDATIAWTRGGRLEAGIRATPALAVFVMTSIIENVEVRRGGSMSQRIVWLFEGAPEVVLLRLFLLGAIVATGLFFVIDGLFVS